MNALHAELERLDVARERESCIAGSTADRQILLGVSHPSNDPALHRTFEIHATYDAANRGWMARFGEKNANDQLVAWRRCHADDGAARRFTSAQACLGSAVTTIIAMVEREGEG